MGVEGRWLQLLETHDLTVRAGILLDEVGAPSFVHEHWKNLQRGTCDGWRTKAGATIQNPLFWAVSAETNRGGIRGLDAL